MSDTCVIGSGVEPCETDKSLVCADRIPPTSLPDAIDEGIREDTHANVRRHTVGGNSWAAASEVEDQRSSSSAEQPNSVQSLRLAMVNDASDCRSGDPDRALQVGPDESDPYIYSGARSSSHASIMLSDDENFTVGRKHSCKVAVSDLEAGLYIDNMSYMDEEEKPEVDICKDENNTENVEATDEDKEVSVNGEKKTGVDFLEKESEVHGLRKRRGVKVDTIRATVIRDSELVRMPEEERRGTAVGTRMKDAPVESCPDAKQKPLDRKTGKQIKGTVKPAGRRVTDSQPLEDLRAKEDAETNRKVHESLDNFIRQTIRCEPYMTFSGRPGDKPLQRLRPDVLENHVGAKFGRGFKVEGGPDSRDIGTEDNLGTDSHVSDVDGLKDTLSASKGIVGAGRGPQHSLKVPPGVVAFTQAAAKGTDLPGWPLLSPSKMTMTKCDKCSREFCSSLNYRRHVRVHRKSLTEKKDLSKERSKVAEFWDKLTPDQASVIVNYENMEIEDLSGTVLLKALAGFIQQPGMPSMAQGLLKAGSALLDIVQNKSSAHSLPSERLLSILDDASEKTFLSGGTSVAYQRFVFNGDAGKVGLEEKNVVASMGFHVELRLVKAWMADKEAEALRNQQALFKEEEAAQQKQAKLLEKRRMKKIRQKERKVTASQLVQELENESLHDEGNLPGVEEDDSPTATGSSASSLVSAHDLVLPGTSDVDLNEELGQGEGRDEQITGVVGEPPLERNSVKDEDSPQLSLDISTAAGQGKSTFFGPEDISESFVSVSRKGDYHSVDTGADDRGSSSLSRDVEELVQDTCREARAVQPFTYCRPGRSSDVQTNVLSRKGDQERATADFVKRDHERVGVDRKSLRIGRDRSRNEYPDAFQKPGRDSRPHDTRYLDGGSQPTFKSRRVNSFALKTDLGTSDLCGHSRSQQYRSKPSGMHRTLPCSGNGQVVWTRKVPQPAIIELCQERKENTIQDNKLPGEVLNTDGENLKVESSGAAECSNPAGISDSGNSVKETTESELVAPAPTLIAAKTVNDKSVVGTPTDSTCVFAGGLVENQEEGLFAGALLVGSLSVPIGKFATEKFVQSRNYPTFPSGFEQSVVSDPNQAHEEGRNDVVLRSKPSVQAVDMMRNESISLDKPESGRGLSGKAESDYTIFVGRPNAPYDQIAKTKPQSPTSGADRYDIGRAVGIPSGHDRLATKSSSWQTSAGRVTSKVWRPVGLVCDRQDAVSGVSVPEGDGEGKSFQDEIDIADRSEADMMFGKKDGDRRSYDCKASASLLPDVVEYSADQALYVSCDNSAISADPEADVALNSVTECSGGSVNEDVTGPTALVSGLCSLSVFLEVAERFLSERWTVAISQASADDYVDCSAGGVSRVAEGCKFTEVISQQLPDQGMRHHPGADSLLCSSASVVTQSLGKTAHDGGVFLSRIFNESDQSRLEGVTHQTAYEDQRLDGGDSGECPMSQAQSPEEDAGTGNLLSFPVDHEDHGRGNENFRSSVATFPVGRVHGSDRHPESRAGGGGSLGYSHARPSHTRQERWYRNPRERFPEQRYMPRRRAPVEKNC